MQQPTLHFFKWKCPPALTLSRLCTLMNHSYSQMKACVKFFEQEHMAGVSLIQQIACDLDGP